MKAEIIAVGTELLLGQIVNTNAQFLSQECAKNGIHVHYQTVVGDNPLRIEDSIRIARSRADLIIFTGGLGPTQDDLTKEVLAKYLNCTIEIHQPSMDKIHELFAVRGSHMVESNIRQAHSIVGSSPLANETGLAVGNAITVEDTHYILLPGPPKEMKPMFINEAVPWLRGLMKDTLPLFSKMLKFAGIGESDLEHRLIDLIDVQTDPTIAPYAKEGEVTIRLTTKAATWEEAVSNMSDVEAEIRARLGEYCYADEDIPLEVVLVKQLELKGKTLSCAESCTGGLLSDMLTAIPGSSQVYNGGIICYNNALKHGLLHVPMDILEGEGAPGAVSEETAILLAEEMRRLAQSNYALSVTGVAGPSPSEGKPVGLVYIGLAAEGRKTIVQKVQLSGNRETIKLKAARRALYMLWQGMNVY